MAKRAFSHGSLKPVGKHQPVLLGSGAAEDTVDALPLSRSARKRAKTAALFYGECYLQGIPPKDAESAVNEMQDCYSKWWLQNRFSDVHPRIEEKREESSEEGDQSCSSVTQPNPKRPRMDVAIQAQPGTSQAVTAVSGDENDCGTSASLPKSRPLKASVSLSTHDRKVARKRRGKDAKQLFLKVLIDSGGEVGSEDFLTSMKKLSEYNRYKKADMLDGIWLTMSNPDFHESIGRTENGDFMYTLGRMAFDMFKPKDLKCSIQGMFNKIAVAEEPPSSMPRSLEKEIKAGKCEVRTYNIVVSFTIEPGEHSDVKEPVRGVMTSYGFIVPDPSVSGRFTVWFSGGVLEPNDETELVDWMKLFKDAFNTSTLQEKAKLLAAKVLLGVQMQPEIGEDGSMSYHLHKPIGGHGVAYFDIVYCDKSLRVLRGSKGSIYVLSRVPMS